MCGPPNGTPGPLPGESHGVSSLAGCSPQDPQESGTIDRPSQVPLQGEGLWAPLYRFFLGGEYRLCLGTYLFSTLAAYTWSCSTATWRSSDTL